MRAQFQLPASNFFPASFSRAWRSSNAAVCQSAVPGAIPGARIFIVEFRRMPGEQANPAVCKTVLARRATGGILHFFAVVV